MVQSVAGNTLHSFRLAVGEIYGDAVVQRGLAMLDPDARLAVEQASSLFWVSMDTLRRVVDAWSTAASVTPEELTERAVRVSTRRNFNTILRAFLYFTSDEALVKRAPLLYARIRNAGKLTIEYEGRGRARALLTEWRNGTDRQMLSLGVSFEELLLFTGREHARCTFKRTHDGAIFDLQWGDPLRYR